MCVCCWESYCRDAKTDRSERGEGLEGMVSQVRGMEAGAPFISNNRKKAKFIDRSQGWVNGMVGLLEIPTDSFSFLSGKGSERI